MGASIASNNEKFHVIYRTVLRAGAALLIELHLLWILFMHVVGNVPYRACIRWYGLIYLVAALVYAIYCFVTDPGFLRKAGRKLKSMFSPEWAIVLFLFVWYIVACAVRQNIDGILCFKNNDYRLFVTAMAALLMFPFVDLMGRKRARRYFDLMMHVASLAFTPFCAWVLWKYTHLEFVTFPSGNKIENFQNAVSLMIGNNRNTTGAQAFAMMCICLYMFMTQRKKVRIAYIPVAAVHLMVLIMSNSRTSYIAFAAMAAVTIFVYGWKRFRKKELVERVLRAVVPAIICIILIHILRVFILSSFAYIPVEAASLKAASAADSNLAMGRGAEQVIPTATKSFATSQDTATGSMPVSAIAATSSPAVRDLSGLSGRPKVWIACFKLMFSAPDKFFFGVTPAHIRQPLQDIGGLNISMPDAHNGILQIGISLGVPSMILYIVFLIMLIVRCIRLLKDRKSRGFPNTWVLSTIIFGILLMDMTETRLFASYRTNLLIFYIFAGWVVYLDKRRKKE